MKIAIACDHGAFTFKEHLREWLKAAGHEVRDCGCHSTESCDYPDTGIPAAQAVSSGECERAILACTNGIGMSMLANRIPGIRAALVYNRRTAETTRKHHDSNVLCLGAQEFAEDELIAFVELWLRTAFEGGRHLRRIGKYPRQA